MLESPIQRPSSLTTTSSLINFSISNLLLPISDQLLYYNDGPITTILVFLKHQFTDDHCNEGISQRCRQTILWRSFNLPLLLATVIEFLEKDHSRCLTFSSFNRPSHPKWHSLKKITSPSDTIFPDKSCTPSARL
ncbi:hypothetical protein L6452_09587 [Arctium lappa]|uniref:Uncharacterized protein n=1 Tax=Arctium lappa TaxID=4217 RepID=A0ACB9DKX1_ARCLA|nr:hypothetical protein L6452_09587 [Arctium lappa]